jgi:hypothetical protein
MSDTETIIYKFEEDRILNELKEYVNSTYSEHYSRQKFQALEFIIDCGYGIGFCIGSILKYAQRYGRKQGYNRKDLLKILHYTLVLLHVHDQKELEKSPLEKIDERHDALGLMRRLDLI